MLTMRRGVLLTTEHLQVNLKSRVAARVSRTDTFYTHFYFLIDF